MYKKIKPESVKKGMYIIIDDSWFSHPFLTNKFKIRTDKQIQKLIESEIETVQIDTEKSNVESNSSADTGEKDDDDRIEIKAPEKWEPERLISEQFRDVIHDQDIDPEQKAKAVYESSLGIMDNLLKNPTAKNIKEFKQGAAEIVDLLLEDDTTANYLLNITSHDYYTYTHSINVGVYSILLAKSLFNKSTNHNFQEMGAGFFLHDIGKTRIDPDIINKRGKLTEEEYEEMKTHPYQGYKILSEKNQLSRESKIIVLQHHERFDGSGYPQQLAGKNIHLYGKICSIADVFDALTSKRSYKRALSPYNALKLMKNEMLDHFQKDIFDEFVLLFKK